MANIVYRQMPAPLELSQQIPAPRAKARMQKPQGRANFCCKSPGVQGGWLSMKLIPAYKADKRFTDLNSAMQQNFLVTGRQIEPLTSKPVLSNFYVPSEDHHNHELTFITLSIIGIVAFCGIMRSK